MALSGLGYGIGIEWSRVRDVALISLGYGMWF